MLLKEILLDANLLVPNTLNDELKVGWLNNVQKQLYRDFAFPNKSYSFITQMGVNSYPIPTDCSRITSAIIDDTKYEYRTVEQDVVGFCYTIEDNNMVIHPTPTRNTPALLTYRQSPQDMTINMQGEKPDYPEDFHEVLVYGIAVRIARAQQDSNKAQELKATFDELHENAQRELRPRNKKVQMNRAWR